MPIVFITRPIPDAGILLLKQANYDIRQYTGEKIIPRDELLKSVKGADAILSLLTEHMDDEVFAAAGPQLKVVANYAVGFDNIDLPAAKKRGITVTNTPSEETCEAVAEHTFALILALAHRITEADAFAKSGQYDGWNPMLFLGTDVYGKTLGVVGAGRIGCSVLQRAVAGFGMKCVYADIRPNTDMKTRFHAERLPLDELLRV